ncbi:ABC-type glutathione transport system ATPase component [Pedobacter sp. UYP30]
MLSVNNLSISFYNNDEKTWSSAINDVSFQVQAGSVLGIVGESGCGKTTLGRSILRLIEPTSGKILFDKQDILELGKSKLRKLRKDIQIIFQDPYAALNPKLTVGQSILEPMQVQSVFANNLE